MPQLTAAYIARKCERLKSGQALLLRRRAAVSGTASDSVRPHRAAEAKGDATKAVDDESIVSARAALAQSTIDASAAEERLQLQQRFVLLLRIKRLRASLDVGAGDESRRGHGSDAVRQLPGGGQPPPC